MTTAKKTRLTFAASLILAAFSSAGIVGIVGVLVGCGWLAAEILTAPPAWSE